MDDGWGRGMGGTEEALLFLECLTTRAGDAEEEGAMDLATSAWVSGSQLGRRMG